MYVAVSLKSGEHIEATKANYKVTRDLLLVCPECGDPVQFKFRQIPHDTPFFAHPKEDESIKLIKACSLRLDGGQFQKASSVVPGISHGQLVNKFQREFCKELYESLGATATTLYEFIKDSRFERLDENHYHSLINTIQSKAPGNEILIRKLGSTEMTFFRGGVNDVCLFLKSCYGVWVGNFLFQTAYFIACMAHQGTLDKALGSGIFRFDDREAIFIVGAKRLLKSGEYASAMLPTAGKRNIAIPAIASALVSFLILKWRFKGHLPSLFVVVDASFDITDASFESVTDLPNTPKTSLKTLRGSRDTPLFVGSKGNYTDAEMKQLVGKVASRPWTRSNAFSHGKEWILFSDIAVMVNTLKCEFVNSSSYELRDGVVTLRTINGTVHIPGKNISWR